MKDDLEVSNKKAVATEKRSKELSVQNMKLVEQMSLFKAKADDLGRELKASYESQLECLWDDHQRRVETLEKEIDDSYNKGFRYYY